MRSLRSSLVAPLVAVTLAGFFVPGVPAPARAAQGQATWGIHVTLAPTWFDPAETPGIIDQDLAPFVIETAWIFISVYGLYKAATHKPVVPLP